MITIINMEFSQINLFRFSWSWRTFPCSTQLQGFSGGCSDSTIGLYMKYLEYHQISQKQFRLPREGTDAIEFRSLRKIITWSLAFVNKSEMKDLNSTIINDILNAFDASLYEENDMFVSEEEFVFDFLNNSKIKEALRYVF